MLRVSVRADVRRVGRDLDRVQRRIVPQVAAQALNRAAAAVRTATVREVSGAKSVRQKLVRGRVRVRKASKMKLTAWINVRPGPMPVVLTGNARQTRSGAKVGRRLIAGGFVAQGRRRVAVFKRDGAARLPISEQMIEMQPEIGAFTERNVRTVGRDRFRREFSRTLAYRLRKKGR